MRLLLVGIGGFAGSVLRYWLGGLAQASAPSSAFPLGTLVVNGLGCFAVGLVAELVEARGFLRPETRALVIVGFLGGFTTFSAFANETVAAANDGAFRLAAGNVISTVVLCLGAAWAGRVIAHVLWR
jgi:CrcB protein